VHYACIDEVYVLDRAGEKHCVALVAEFRQTTRAITRVFLRRVAAPTQQHVCHEFANQLLAFRPTVVTDCAPMYLHGFDQLLAQTRHNNHSRDQFVLNDGATSNPAESVFARFRDFMSTHFGTIRSGEHLDGIAALFELRWRNAQSWGEVAAAQLTTLLQWRCWEDDVRQGLAVATHHTADRASFSLQHRDAITALARTRAAQAPQMAAGARHRDPLAAQRGPAFAQAPTGAQRLEREGRVAAGVQRRVAVGDAPVLAFATPQGSQQDAVCPAAPAPTQLTQPSQRARRGAAASPDPLPAVAGRRRPRVVMAADTQATLLGGFSGDIPAPVAPTGSAAREGTADAPCVGCGKPCSDAMHASGKFVECAACNGWVALECSKMTEKAFDAVDEHDPTTFFWCPACDRAHGARVSSSDDDGF
jgi:hypothetical protein